MNLSSDGVFLKELRDVVIVTTCQLLVESLPDNGYTSHAFEARFGMRRLKGFREMWTQGFSRTSIASPLGEAIFVSADMFDALIVQTLCSEVCF